MIVGSRVKGSRKPPFSPGASAIARRSESLRCCLAIELIRLVVHPDTRRQRIGAQMLMAIAAKVTRQRRRIDVRVSEWDTGAHLFLSEFGFIAVEVGRGEETDFYRFEYPGREAE